LAILPQVRRDAEFLRNLISNLRSDCTTVHSNGVWLTGEALEANLASARESNGAELRKLELILETRMVPEKYISMVTKETYYPAADEVVRPADYFVGILPQVRNDAEYLRNLIPTLRTATTADGRLLTGVALDAALEKGRADVRAQLRRKELILKSGIIPDKYTSITTKETYYPSAEEKIKRSEPLPTANYTMFSVKKSRKGAKLPNSTFKVVRSDASHLTDFFIEHKEDKSYPKGGFAAKVKKGYLTEGSTEPKYAIKIYHKNMFSDDTIHELRIAMRATYCYKQLGREGFAFRRNGKQYLVTEWLQGATLEHADQESIQSMPIPRRIVMAISLLRELSILHKQGLIHNDIKPSNVMVSYGKLSFVDLDSVRPKNEMPLHGTTPMFTNTYLPNPQMSYDAEHNSGGLYLKFNEATDMYAMGITLAHLFQEIYTPRPEARKIKVTGGSTGTTHTFNTFSLVRGTKYAEHPALQKLLKQMIFQEDPTLVPIDQLIEAFQAALSTYSDYEQYLEEDKLVGLGSELSAEDGAKAFDEIEVELLGYNQRLEAVRGLRI
jgi:serine/threonine protein kinase